MERLGELLTVAELAAAWRCNVSSIYRWARTGQIPAMRVGDLWRFDRAAIERWMSESTIALGLPASTGNVNSSSH